MCLSFSYAICIEVLSVLHHDFPHSAGMCTNDVTAHKNMTGLCCFMRKQRLAGAEYGWNLNNILSVYILRNYHI